MKQPQSLTTLSALAVLLQPGLAMAHSDHGFAESFLPSAFAEAPELVSCELSDGTTGECYEFTVNYLPEDLEFGPFCPVNTEDTGGLWHWDGDEAGLYRIDGAFLEMLKEQGFTFYDDDGNVYVTDIRTERPAQTNTCLEASFDTDVTMTLRIPAHPHLAEAPSDLGTVAKVGIAVDGVPIFADAPSVLDTGHMPALDVCGGHVDPGGWYHWHATATDIDTALDAEGVAADCTLTQDSAALFGYAFDGFPIFGSREADGTLPEDLDACGGHGDGSHEGYHYHAAENFPNLPVCLVGVTAVDNFTTTAAGGIGAVRAGGGEHTPPDLEAVAAELGVDPNRLMEALGGPGERPDFAAVAETLGVSEADLRDALPAPAP